MYLLILECSFWAFINLSWYESMHHAFQCIVYIMSQCFHYIFQSRSNDKIFILITLSCMHIIFFSPFFFFLVLSFLLHYFNLLEWNIKESISFHSYYIIKYLSKSVISDSLGIQWIHISQIHFHMIKLNN